MKAAVYHGQRDVRIEDVPAPGPPGAGEVTITVAMAAICGTDLGEYLHGPLMIPLERRHPSSGHLGPVVLGHEFVGRVTAGGTGVDPTLLGRRVVPGAGYWCGECRWCREGRPNLCARYFVFGIHANGGLTESVVVPARMCHVVSDDCADEAAAMAQPLAIALHAVRRSGAGPSDRVVVIGAGGIGAFILLAVHRLAPAALIAVDVAEERLDTARKLGATTTLNSVQTDALAAIRTMTEGVGADVVIEASGTPVGLRTAVAAARRGGRVHLVGLQATAVAIDEHDLVVREVDIRTSNGHVCDTDLPEALELLSFGDSNSVLDRIIELDDLVAGGLEAMARGETRGKVLVRCPDTSDSGGRL